MTRAPGFSIYNQDRLDDIDFVANFVARNKQAETLLNGLRNIAEGGPVEHQILIGARGMGKTSLLRRLAIGITGDPDLNAAYIPLRFREEQYNIISLDVFWRNCGESLAEYCEQQGNQALADQLDLAIETPEWRDDAKARDAFLAACHEAGGRPILLLDNLDLILAGIKREGSWSLRNALQKSDGPIVIGAATQLLSEGADRDAPFYEFFNPHILEPLSESELLACLNALATKRGIPGARVKVILAKEPARVRALYVLTGGNPRILTLIYGLLEQADSETIFADLETLLDQVTPFYKARVEEYQTPLQRAVIDGIALNWDPITSGVLSQQTGVEATTLSPQLIRLKRDGLVEEVETSGTRAGYQLSERFLNIWYLMRHGTRKTKQRLRWFTLFLTKLFSAEDIQRMAGDARSGKSSSHPFYREALYEAYDLLNVSCMDSSDTDDLNHQFGSPTLAPSSSSGESIDIGNSTATKRLKMIEVKNGRLLKASKYSDVLKLEAVAFEPSLSDPVHQNLVARLKNGRGIALNHLNRPEEAILVFDEVLEHVSGSAILNLQEREVAALVNKAEALFKLGRWQDAVAVYEDIVARFSMSDSPSVLTMLIGALFEKGRKLRKLKKTREAIAAFDQVVEHSGTNDKGPTREIVALALVNKALMLSDLNHPRDVIAVCDEIVSRFAASGASFLQVRVAWAFNQKGRALRKLRGLREAVASFDQVLERFGAKSGLALNEEVAWALVNRVSTLIDLDLREDAIANCREIVSRFGASDVLPLQSRVAWALNEEGRQLQRLGRHEVAIPAFDQVLQRFGTSEGESLRIEISIALINKALSLVDLNRTGEATTVFDDVVSRFEASDVPFLQGQVAWALTEKGRGFKRLKRPEEAIAIFDQVLDRFGESDALEPSRAVAAAVVDRASCLVDIGEVDEALCSLRAEARKERSAKGIKSAAHKRRMALLEFSIGWILFCYLYDIPGAAAAFSEAAALEKEFGKDSVPASANLCWVLLASSDLAAAKEVFARLDEFTGVGRRLWDAGFEIVADNLEASLAHLDAVLHVGLEDEGFEYFEALLWYLRIAAERGYGERVIAWFVATGNADRYAPVYGALVAHVRGARLLLDLNPEVRGVARPLYSRLSAGAGLQEAEGEGRKRKYRSKR